MLGTQKCASCSECVDTALNETHPPQLPPSPDTFPSLRFSLGFITMCHMAAFRGQFYLFPVFSTFCKGFIHIAINSWETTFLTMTWCFVGGLYLHPMNCLFPVKLWLISFGER